MPITLPLDSMMLADKLEAMELHWADISNQFMNKIYVLRNSRF